MVFNLRTFQLKSYQCSDCEFTGATRSTVTNHFKRVHLQMTLKHVVHRCGYCDYSTDNVCTLRDHEKAIHLGIKDKRCDECGFTCTAASSLKRHKMTHTGERPFKCEWPGCGYASNRRNHLQVYEHSSNTAI